MTPNRTTRLSLGRLAGIVEELSTERDLDALLASAVKRITDAMSVDACAIYLTDRVSGQHTLAAVHGLTQARDETVAVLGEELLGQVVKQLKPVNLCGGLRLRHRRPGEVGEQLFRAFLGVPIMFQGHLIGILVVMSRTPRRFTEARVSFLFTLAVHFASQIEFARIAKSVVRKRGAVDDEWLNGVPAAPGIGVGAALVLYPLAESHSVPEPAAGDPVAEEASLLQAIDRVRLELENLAEQMGTDSQHASLLRAYAMIVTSDELVGGALQRVRAGAWAPNALTSTVEEIAAVFDGMDDIYLRERARDVRDLGQRVLRQLIPNDSSEIDYPERTVLLGREVSAIDLMRAPRGRISGVISQHGSSCSHIAIIARALGIPAVTGIGDLPFDDLNHRELVVDGYRGRVYVDPKPTQLREFQRLAQQEHELSQFLDGLHDAAAVTPDGIEIAVLVNAGLPDDVPLALNAGAQGVGLYRTELLFMTRDRFPTEDQQVNAYRKLLEAFKPRPVTLRTLDVGGDKQLPYLPIVEQNPALGWRGIRISLDHPEILHTQLRAMLRAAQGLDNAKLLFPMLSSVEELDKVLEHIDAVVDEMRSNDINIRKPPVGAMVEVPSAVFQAPLFAARTDFLAIGTNDLTQYMLAVDRDNERVATLFDTLHPALLRAISNVIESGRALGKPVSVCGEFAADPAAVLLLLGMGVSSLSVSAGDIGRVKWVVRSFTAAVAEELSERALQMESSASIRAMLNDVLIEAGLGALVRPGR